ncbi:hypothetical protein ANCCEY_09846 [Ancylostoma ceylanicum]|uniref:SCP domain-containing protein n=1 Tax=Ancylostoma ceylanicum TaxID=53326 RepID=A0A0D6LGF6_9BILA|nr:hypothetical protein ANCCEY_09846 [Ancylostoma ceylanicum]
MWLAALVWDCNLEQEAHNEVKKCTDYGGKRAANEDEITGKPCNVTSGAKDILKKWWKEVVNAPALKDGNKYNKNTIPHFGVMAFHETTIMACAYEKCDASTKLLCLYNKKPSGNKPLYTAGDMCADAGCKCIDRLCQTEPKHIADSSTCKKALMTDEMEKTAVDMHNYYRRLIATGWAEDPKSLYAPRASKMNYLVGLSFNGHNNKSGTAMKDTKMQKFDCDNLAAPMKTAINKCQVPADTAGQNVHVINRWDISRQAALEEAITTWYEGLQKGGGIGEDTIYTPEMEANKMLKQYATVQDSNKRTFSAPVETDPIYTHFCPFKMKLISGGSALERRLIQ